METKINYATFPKYWKNTNIGIQIWLIESRYKHLYISPDGTRFRSSSHLQEDILRKREKLFKWDFFVQSCSEGAFELKSEDGWIAEIAMK